MLRILATLDIPIPLGIPTAAAGLYPNDCADNDVWEWAQLNRD